MKETPLEILTNEQMAEADKLAVAMGVPSPTLMENAGRAVADEVEKMVDAPITVPSRTADNRQAPDARGQAEAWASETAPRIVVLCGPGNNGGDGFVAARYLKERGYDVSVYLYGEIDKLKGDASEMAKRWLAIGEVLPFPDEAPAGPPGPERGRAHYEMQEACKALFRDAHLIIDAILGAGLSRELPEIVGAVVIAAVTSGHPILAVDVPTGISGTTGEPSNGSSHIWADATVTFFRLKPAHVCGTGKRACGRVVLADIGIPATIVNQQARIEVQRKNPGKKSYDIGGISCFRNAPGLWLSSLSVPEERTHKYQRGHAVAVSGPAQSTGAIRLAARAALRVGAGLVTVASPKAAFPVNAAHLTAVMVQPFEVPHGLSRILDDKRRNAVLLGPGCGVGGETREMVQIALKSEASCVLDADALTTIAMDPDSHFSGMREKGQVRAREADGDWPAYDLTTVLTPHEGEFQRLFPEFVDIPSRLEKARRAAHRAGCVIVLKGSDTIIAEPPRRLDMEPLQGRAAISTNAPPWLATAGSGDVLAGLITGLLAQGMPAFEAACAAVWIHGECANRFGPGLIAEDLPDMVPSVLRDLYARKQELMDEERAERRRCNRES